MIGTRAGETTNATFLGMIGGLVGCVALVALIGPPAAASQNAAITVSPGRPTPGEHVTVRGSGFCPEPCSAVTISEDGSIVLDGISVSAAGTFEVQIGLAPVSGSTSIVATQTDGSGVSIEASATIMIVASDQTGTTTGTTTTTGPTTTVPPEGSTTTTEPGEGTTTSTTTVPPTTSPPTTGTTMITTTTTPRSGSTSWSAIVAGVAALGVVSGAVVWLVRRRRGTLGRRG